MCVSNNIIINPVFNLSSNLCICFHQFPNLFVIFITFKSDNGIFYNRVIVYFRLLLFVTFLGNITIVIIKMHDATCILKYLRFNT